MAKEIWKLGKFHKGINSHTDPKDISSEEWVVLDDINVSKVGVAKPIGQPETNLIINPLEVEGSLIPGKGFYRFNSDDTYLLTADDHSYHYLRNTRNASSGNSSDIYFGIKNAVWVFEYMPASVTNLKFTLKVNGAPIMEPLVVLNGTLPQNAYQEDSVTTTTNVFAGSAAMEDDWEDVGFETNYNPIYTNIPHNIVDDAGFYNPPIQWCVNWQDIPGPYMPETGGFWAGLGDDNCGSIDDENLNDENLFFSATYDSDGYPNGELDYNEHYMLGFYAWEGYPNGMRDSNGQNTITSDSHEECGSFFVPSVGHALGWDWSFDYWPTENYHKARLNFMSALIQKINDFSGTTDTDFHAAFDGYAEEEYESGEGIEDMIYMQTTENSTVGGTITADLTVDAVGSANFIEDGDVDLLTDSDRQGQGAGNSDIISDPPYINDWEDPTNSNGVTFTGESALNSGSIAKKEIWELTIRGNPNSGDIINIQTIGVGSQITDSVINVQATYATNQLYAEEIRDVYNATGNGATAVAAATSDFPDDVYTPWMVTISSNSSGFTRRFNMIAWWEDSNGLRVGSQGIDDEQLALTYKTGASIGSASNHNGITLRKTGFKIFSTLSTTWIDFYNNNAITALTDRDANTYLDWFYTDSNDNDPIFWDEGSALRITETNFSLLKELDSINFQDIFQNSDGTPKDNNPSQWIGFKDLRKHFGQLYDYLSNDYGYFIGKTSKIWEYTTTDDTTGVLTAVADLDNDGSLTFGAEEHGMRFYFFQGSAGLDWIGTIQIYLVACYDDGSESLPGHAFASSGGDFGEAEEEKSLKMQLLFKPETGSGIKLFSDARINGVRLYYTHSEESHSTFWDLGKLDFNRGFIKSTTLDTVDNTAGNQARYEWAHAIDLHADYLSGNLTVNDGSSTIIEYTEMPKSKTYEDINGYTATAATLNVDYKATCIAGRRTFIGNLRVWNGSYFEYYNDRMVVSPVNSLDTFPYPDNILELDISDGDKIVALSSYGDKVMQFKERILYIVNISTGIAAEFYIEERLKWKGIANKNHMCTTDKGIFWVNERGAWIYDGEEVTDLFIQDDTDVSQQRISSEEWSSFISDETLVGYNALSREVVITKTHTPTESSDGDCFIYNLIVSSFTKGKKKFYTATNKSMTNIQSNGSLGKISYLVEQSPGDGIDNTEIR